ncbi:MAG: SycD/LcrH family type III secretion system chaperone [Waddliaceae bacterium]
MKTSTRPSQLKDEKAMQSFIEKFSGENVAMPQLSPEALEDFYAFGYGLYDSGQYENAMHYFRFLTLVDMQNRKHWMGLGASYQMLKEYDRALQSYGYAALLDENDPNAHFHAAECFFANNQAEPGNQALSSAKTAALLEPEKYKSLLARIELMNERKEKSNK